MYYLVFIVVQVLFSIKSSVRIPVDTKLLVGGGGHGPGSWQGYICVTGPIWVWGGMGWRSVRINVAIGGKIP